MFERIPCSDWADGYTLGGGVRVARRNYILEIIRLLRLLQRNTLIKAGISYIARIYALLFISQSKPLGSPIY